MPKILPIGIGIILLATAFYLLTVNKTSSTPYSSTNPGKYNTTPSPESTNLITYTNTKYGLTLEYPTKGLDPQDNIINCGKYISSDTTMFSPNETITIDNIAIIQTVNSSKSIDEYINSQGASGLYNTIKITSSGAEDAIKIDGFKKDWAGEGYAPMGYVSDIYKKDGKLFLIMLQQNFLNNGCISPKDLNNTPSFIDKTWKIEDHLRFN
jgi:hypothetical protein